MSIRVNTDCYNDKNKKNLVFSSENGENFIYDPVRKQKGKAYDMIEIFNYSFPQYNISFFENENSLDYAKIDVYCRNKLLQNIFFYKIDDESYLLSTKTKIMGQTVEVFAFPAVKKSKIEKMEKDFKKYLTRGSFYKIYREKITFYQDEKIITKKVNVKKYEYPNKIKCDSLSKKTVCPESIFIFDMTDDFIKKIIKNDYYYKIETKGYKYQSVYRGNEEYIPILNSSSKKKKSVKIDDFSMDDLKKLATEKKISGRSKMNKKELFEELFK